MTVRCMLCGNLLAYNVLWWPRRVCYRNCPKDRRLVRWSADRNNVDEFDGLFLR